MMNAREYLNSLLETSNRIKIKQAQIRRLHEGLTSISVPLDKEQVSHTRNVSVMADTIAKVTDMEAEIDQQISSLYEKRQQALHFFDELKPIYTQILTMRYIDEMKYEEIGKNMGYAMSSVFRIIKDATNALQVLFNHYDL